MSEIKLKDAIKAFIKVSPLKPKLDEAAIIVSWEKLMGKAIAKYTTKIYVKDRKLFVKLSSSVLREELMYGKSKIIKMMNDAVGEKVIEDVIIM